MVDAALRRAGLEDGVIRVELHPALDVALARNRERGSKPFDPAILEPAIRAIDADIRAAGVLRGWTRLDNGGEPVEATVGRILALSDAIG
jgi:hypothetical protein